MGDLSRDLEKEMVLDLTGPARLGLFARHWERYGGGTGHLAC